MTTPDIKAPPVPALFHAFDAAFPPSTAPADVQAVCGYLGGPTPHVWTLQEWQRFGDLRQAGIWLYEASQDAATAGHQAAAAAKRLGWKPFADVRRVIWLDMELKEDPAWIAGFAAAVHGDGFVAGDYRSLSSDQAGGDPHVLGKWLAAWDGVQSVEDLPFVVGHQYRANVPCGGSVVDLSVFSGKVWEAFGHGPRHLVS